MSEMHQSGYMPKQRNGNRLLVESQLGKAKPSTYVLPPKQFVYGTNTPQDPQKANVLIYKWKQHQVKENKNINKFKDFIDTNRKCVKSMLHTASDFSNFRKTSVSFKKVKQGSKLININLPQEEFTYGKPLQLEDPIKMVMANHYGQTDKLNRRTFYMKQHQRKNQTERRKLSCHMTKNHYLVKEAAQKRLEKFNWTGHGPSFWKLSKFQNVAPKIDTNKNNLKMSRPTSAKNS